MSKDKNIFRLFYKTKLNIKDKTVIDEKTNEVIHRFKDDHTRDFEVDVEFVKLKFSFRQCLGFVVFRTRLPNNHLLDKNVDYAVCDVSENHNHHKLVPYFKNPIEIHDFGDVFRIVPSASCLMVNRTGTRVINWYTGNELKLHVGTTVYYYVVYTHPGLPVKKHRVHRLVASAWVDNPDITTKFQVNHIDGNRQNNHADNLEWCTCSENINHSYDNLDRNGQSSCQARDIETGEIINARSINELRRLLPDVYISCKAMIERKSHPIVGNKYEIKYTNDDTGWFFEGVKIYRRDNENCGKYLFIVEHEDGSKTGYLPRMSLFLDILGKPDFHYVDNKTMVRRLSRRYPGKKFTYQLLYERIPIELTHVDSGKKEIFDNVFQLKRKYKIGENKSRRVLRDGSDEIIENKYKIRYVAS